MPNPNALEISTTLNGKRVQGSNTSDMISGVPALIEYFGSSTTVVGGTVITIGTSSGVMAREPETCWLRPGGTVTVEIERIGARQPGRAGTGRGLTPGCRARPRGNSASI